MRQRENDAYRWSLSVIGGRPQPSLLDLLWAVQRGDGSWGRLAGDVREWDAVVQASGRAGIDGLFVQPSGMPRAHVPDDVARRMAARDLLASVARQHHEDVLVAAVDALNDADIPVVVLKGLLFGQRWYRGGLQRRSVDIDMMVSAEHLVRAENALRTIGYRRARPTESRYWARHHHHIQLNRPDGPPLDLHFKLTTNFGAHVAAAPIIADAEPFQVADRDVLVLSPVDELVHIAQHTAQDLGANPRGLFDTGLLAMSMSERELQRVDRRARSESLGAAVTWALRASAAASGAGSRGRLRRKVVIDPLVRTATSSQVARVPRALCTLSARAALADDPASAARLIHASTVGWFVVSAEPRSG